MAPTKWLLSVRLSGFSTTCAVHYRELSVPVVVCLSPGVLGEGSQ